MSNNASSVNINNFKYLVLDLNGTLTLDGSLLEGVAERLQKLSGDYQLFLLTADMHGTGREVSDGFDMTFVCIESNNEAFNKGEFIRKLGPGGVVAIGAGNNDAQMLEVAALGIAVLGPEGLSNSAMHAADIIAPNILNALDLLLFPQRLAATLRA